MTAIQAKGRENKPKRGVTEIPERGEGKLSKMV